MEWADARVWAVVSTAAPADARLRELLEHAHTVQHAFLAIWRRGNFEDVVEQCKQLSSLEDVRRWAQTYYSEVHELLANMDEEQLAANVEMPWAAQIEQHLGRPPGPTTVAETIFQVTSHSTYHRGQVNARLRELGAAPPPVDYIAWLWGERPAAHWA
jgi:uncharacterized damage-inducible protein DinB